MRLQATLYNRNQSEIKLIATKKQLDDLNYALFILKINQNTNGEPESDKQSVRAYKLLNQLFSDLGI
jgi:hypothetical protein